MIRPYLGMMRKKSLCTHWYGTDTTTAKPRLQSGPRRTF